MKTTVNFLLGLMLFAVAEPVMAKCNFLQLNVQLQSVEMRTPAHFAKEMVPCVLDGQTFPSERRARVVENIRERDAQVLQNAFRNNIPQVEAVIWPGPQGEHMICLYFHGDFEGMKTSTNLGDFRSLDRSFNGLKDGSIYCVTELDEFKSKGAYIVLSAEDEIRQDGTRDLRKRFALYVELL